MGFDGVGAGAYKCLDTQVLFDPLEEQFDLPAAFIKLGNVARWQIKMVGQKRDVAGLLDKVELEFRGHDGLPALLRIEIKHVPQHLARRHAHPAGSPRARAASGAIGMEKRKKP